MSGLIVEARELSRVYRQGALEVLALRRASFTVQRGELVAIMGPSALGKSTLLYLLGCLVRPTGGLYRLEGRDVTRLSGSELAQVRGCWIGFVFQSFHLLPSLSALRNVELPALYNGGARTERRERARWLLERVSLRERLHHRPAELSGGEAQRVAIARALMNDPTLILADEPTGNLDSTTGHEIMALLAELRGEGRTVVVVTHDSGIAQRWADRVLHIRDGVLEGK
ncbi:MAG TPA: macrolide ABC transporter ATP-binding protein [Chloroflexi bacterium]|nr:macrolide ABC transporter ATP-binding protein [Chloroflexota bacterium]